jgi:hypothetical protein
MPRGRKNRFQQSPPADADLVAAHFQDLAAQPEELEMARRKPEIPPPPESSDELPEDPEEEEPEDEPEEPDGEPLGAAPEPEPAPEPASAATLPPPPKKTRQRKKGPGGDMSHVVMGAAPVDAWPLEAGLVWEKILLEAAKIHRSPQNMYINVDRLAISGYAAEPVSIGQIEGEAVAGGESVTPATALREYMIDVFHARAPGPAKYRLDFNWKRGGRIKMGEFRFGHPHEMMQQRAYAQARAAAGQPGGGAPPPGIGAMPAQAYAPIPGGGPYAQIPTYMQQPPYASQYPPYYPPQQPAAAAAMDPSTMAEIGYLRGSLNEALAAIREKREPNLPPPPPAVAAPAADQEDARVARVVVGVLQSYGLRPGAAPAVAQAQAAPVGFGSVVERAREQIGGLKQLASIFKEVERLKDEMGFGGAAEEPETEVVTAQVQDPNAPAFEVRKIPFAKFKGQDVLWPQRGDDESLLMEWLPRFIASNPQMGESVLEKAMQVLDQGAFGSLLGRLAQQGGPAAQAAQAMGDRMSNGAGVGSQPPPRGYPAP